MDSESPFSSNGAEGNRTKAETEQEPKQAESSSTESGTSRKSESAAVRCHQLEALEKLKEILQSPVFETLAASFGKSMEGFAAKRREEIELRKQLNELNAKYLSSNRWFFIVGLSICLAFLGFVLWLFKDQRETLLPVLTALIGLVAGAGGGFIFGQRQVRSDS